MTTIKQNTAIKDLHAAGAHLVICHPQMKRPIWPLRGGLDGKTTYPLDHAKEGEIVSAGYQWQQHPAPLPTAKDAQLFGLKPSSLGFVVVDVDVDKETSEDRRAEEAANKADAITESVGPPIIEVTTPSLGIHMFYRCAEPVANRVWTMKGGRKGGELRGSNGFVCLYDPDAVSVALENIEDYDPVDLSKWPFSDNRPRKNTAPPAKTKHPKRTVEELNEILSHISPDIPHDEWVKAGMALHAEGYELAVWDAWSSRGKTYTPEECAKRWQSFSGDSVKMGTLINMAKDAGWKSQHGGARIDAGRPEKDSGADADRILDNFANQLVSVFNGGVYIRNKRGLLIPLSRRNEDGLTDIDRILKECGDERTHGGRHLAEVLTSLRAAAGNADDVLQVALSDMDRRIAILPTTTGGYDLRTGETVSAESMAAHLQTERGYLFTPPLSDMPDSEAGEIVLKLWEDRFRHIGRRIACHLLNARPLIDVAIGESGTGKGTLISLTKRAFPGMIASIGIKKAMGAQGRKWSVVENALGESLVVFIDEADKTPDKEIDAGQVNGWVDGEVDVEKKGQDHRTVPRRGTVIMIGGDFPHLPFDAQGMGRRFRAVYEIAGQMEIEPHEWWRVNDTADVQDLNDSANMFKWLVVQECHRLANDHDPLETTETEESSLACSQMLQERRPEEVKELDGRVFRRLRRDRICAQRPNQKRTHRRRSHIQSQTRRHVAKNGISICKYQVRPPNEWRRKNKRMDRNL